MRPFLSAPAAVRLMLRSAVFSNLTGWMAILANAVGLGLWVPSVGLYISVLSVLFLEIWYVLVARGLLRLGRGVADDRGAV